MKLKQKLEQFLVGRYGGDPLNTVLCIVALALFIVGSILGSVAGKAGAIIAIVLYLAAAAGIGYSFFRMLSRDLTARRKEYETYRKKIVEPLRRAKSEFDTRRKQRKTHKFFKCPKCRQTVRVPRGKGKVRITCPKCGEVFIKET